MGSSNPGFTAENDDERCEDDNGNMRWGWHFLMPVSGVDFLTLTATFTNAGTVPATAFYSASGQVKHAYVFTPGPDTLLGASATTDPATGGPYEFNLSHVCNGTTTTTTTSTDTTTSPSVLSSVTSTDPGGVGSGGLDQDDPSIVPANVGDDTLARTGSDSGTLLLLGGVLLIIGLLLVRYTRTD